MLNGFFNGLSTLILTVKRNTFSAVMTTLMCLALIFAWSARGNISAWLDQNPSVAERNRRFSEQTRVDEIIQERITADRDYLGADRIFVRQFHKMLTPENEEIDAVTVTYMSAAPGVSVAKSTPIPKARVQGAVSRVFPIDAKPRCVKRDYDDVQDPIYKKMLQDSGVKFFFVCPIVDISGAPIGMIYASFISEYDPRAEDEIIYQRLSETSGKIAGYLDEVEEQERDAWYRRWF